MKKNTLPSLSLVLMLASCTPVTVSLESSSSSPSSEGPLVSSSLDSSLVSSPETSSSETLSSEDRKESFTPSVGEVRKWFDHGEAGDTRIYNYCPSVFVEDGIKHIYYCSNKDEGNVTDYVGYREGRLVDDKMSYTPTSEMKFVLGPTEGTWDSRHTCDPSVLKGEFTLSGEKYFYLMAYLGCVTSDNSKNEVGIAVSKTPSGPWIKADAVNPLIPYDPDIAAWGTGQPSLVSSDHLGKVCIFYSVGNTTGTHTEVKEYDLSDLSSPKLLRTKIVPEYGIKGNATVIANAGFAYDEVNKKILMVKGRQPFGSDGETPEFIADTLDVYAMDDSENENKFDEVFKGNNAKNWKRLGTINKELTGFSRNHNSGFVTDCYGSAVESDRIEVAFTRSDLSSSFWGYLSTYRIYSTSISLSYD